MKNLHTLLQNALEDYLMSLDHPATLADVQTICETNLSCVVWKALREVNHLTKDTRSKDPIINGIKQSQARNILKQVAESLIGNSMAKRYGSVRQLFRDSTTYGFRFSFITNADKAWQTTLPEYDEDNISTIVGYQLELIK